MRSLPFLRDLPEPYASALAIAAVVLAGWLGTRLLLAFGQRLAARAGWGALETALARVNAGRAGGATGCAPRTDVADNLEARRARSTERGQLLRVWFDALAAFPP